MVCAVCFASAEVDKSQTLLSAEQKLLDDAERQSVTCTDSYMTNCTTSASSQFSDSIRISDGQLQSSNSMSSLSDRNVNVAATDVLYSSSAGHGGGADIISGLHSTASDSLTEGTDREVVTVNSPVSSFIADVVDDSAGHNSATDLRRHSCLSTDVKSTRGTKHCSSDVSLQGCSNQLSIRSFFQPTSKVQYSKKNSVQSTLSHSRDVMLHANSKIQNNSVRNVDHSHSVKTDANDESVSSAGKTSKCPFYKWIRGKAACSCYVKLHYVKIMVYSMHCV